MADDAGIQLLAQIGPFLGYDGSTDPVMVSGEYSVDGSNYDNRRYYGSLCPPLGSYFNALTGFTGSFVTLFGSSPTTVTNQSINVTAYTIAAGVGHIQTCPGNSGVPSDITLPTGITIGNSGYSFCEYGKSTYASGLGSDGTSRSLLQIQSDATSVEWQINPPTVSPGVSNGGAGNLLGQYYYCYTYSGGISPIVGVTKESSRSPVQAINFATPGQAALTATAPPAGSQANVINWYRLGGTIATWQQVGSTNLPSTTFTDNTGDANVTGGALVLHRDPPPVFSAMCVHKGRVWGWAAGVSSNINYPWVFSAANAYTNMTQMPSDLWFSGFNEPWSFDSVNNIIPIDRNVGGDYGVNVFSMSSILAALKHRSLWVVYGDSESDFRAVKYADIGAVNFNCTATGYGLIFFISLDGNVWQFDGGSLTNISEAMGSDIRQLLQNEIQNAISQSSVPFSSWQLFVHDRALHIMGANVSALLTYSLRSQKWCITTTQIKGPTFVDFRCAAPKVYTAGFKNSSNLDLAFRQEGNSDGTGVQATWLSGWLCGDTFEKRKAFRFVTLLAQSPGAGTVTLFLYLDNQAETWSQTVTLRTAASLSYYRFSLPATMVGHLCQVRIVTTPANGPTQGPIRVQSVKVFGTIREDMPKPVDSQGT